jgi:hypothetical protein
MIGIDQHTKMSRILLFGLGRRVCRVPITAFGVCDGVHRRWATVSRLQRYKRRGVPQG